MKKKIFFITLIELIVASLYFYIALPPLNISSSEFWSFIIFLLAVLLVLITISNFTGNFKTIFKSLLILGILLKI